MDKNLRTDNADTKAGKKNRPINDKGSPILRVGSVPGYNKGTGTPGWIKSAASHAEGLKDFSSQEHRSHGHQGGAPPRGKSPEKIHGGQGSRVGKDSD